MAARWSLDLTSSTEAYIMVYMKKCSACHQELPLSAFNKKGSAKDGLQYKCRECSKSYYKNYYDTVDKERERLKNKRAAFRSEVRTLLRDIKNVPCTDCGVRYNYYTMHFDHLGGKEFGLAEAVNKGMSVKRILAEVEKCEVVCANCHSERTYQRSVLPG